LNQVEQKGRMMTTTHSLHVWGNLACFSRPDAGKVERFSYPLITPSAARAIFEAILWKPRFRWQVTRIEVLKPPRYIALRRNEVKNKAPSEQTIRSWMTGAETVRPIWADGASDSLGTDQEGRTQRQTMALKDVAYVLHAELRPWPDAAADGVGLDAQFQRRAARGQCIYQPYLGCREFPAYFRVPEPDEKFEAYPLNLDLGWMLYDVFDLRKRGTSRDSPFISLFQAKVTDGVAVVPEYESPDVVKPEVERT
jgi:CRISPR-associated protein Cas5d